MRSVLPLQTINTHRFVSSSITLSGRAFARLSVLVVTICPLALMRQLSVKRSRSDEKSRLEKRKGLLVMERKRWEVGKSKEKVRGG